MNKIRLIVTITVLSFISGCATKPLVDPKSSANPANYYADEMECNRIAENISYPAEMAKSATINAIVSALLGAALAKGGTSPNTGAAIGASTGLLVGAGMGASNTYLKRQDVVKKCLIGRGYKVLD